MSGLSTEPKARPAELIGVCGVVGLTRRGVFFFQAEDGIRDVAVTGVQTCALPILVLFAEWRYLRTGDSLYRTLARRWSKIMLALFAVGVVTGTILSFELGLLWPVWIQDFGNVFGLGFTLEGFSFFVEAIFIGIYVYGWDRLTPRAHFLSGLPIALAGITGSMFVISVNAWMN